MLITSIFGKDLRDTHEYVGWLEETEMISISDDEDLAKLCYRIYRAHTILDQPMTEESLEMFKGEWEIGEDGILIYNYDDHKPLMTFDLADFKTRNAFATHCLDAGIPLELNEEYQIQ